MRNPGRKGEEERRERRKKRTNNFRGAKRGERKWRMSFYGGN